MKLQIMSDLHLEFAAAANFVPPRTEADGVILAGDIHTGTHGLTWARLHFPDQVVIYVAGNHEFYNHTWSTLLPKMRRTAEQLGIVFLERGAIELGGVRFLGTTLWTDFDLYGAPRREEMMRRARVGMYDYTAISLRPPLDRDPLGRRAVRLTPEQTRRWSLRAQAWLREELAAPFLGPTVVVTHHLPTMLSVSDYLEDDVLNPAFASNLDDLLRVPRLWVHGHTHDSKHYRTDSGTRVVCNPRGYANRNGQHENMAFRGDLVVDVATDEANVGGGDV